MDATTSSLAITAEQPPESARQAAAAAPKKRYVLVKKKVVPGSQADGDPLASTKKRVIVARKLQPGESIASLSNSPTGSGEDLVLLPESLVLQQAGATLPRRDATGQLVASTVLGSVEEYEEMLRRQAEEQRRAEQLASQRSALSLGLSANQLMAQEEGLKTHRERLAKREELLGHIATMRKAREEEVAAGQALLKRLTIQERIDMEKEQRALSRWEEVNREWDRFRDRMAKRLGKNAEELVISRSNEYREMLEEVQIYQQALPEWAKSRSHVWEMSLRNGGERYDKIGHALDPIYFPIRNDKPKQLELVRRTMRSRTRRNPDPVLRSSLATFKHSPYLAAQERRWAREIAALVAHRPEFAGLELVGLGYEAALAADAEASGRLAAEAREAAAAAVAIREPAAEDEFADEGPLAPPPPAPEEAAPRWEEGPAVEVGGERLAMHGGVGELLSAALEVANVGSTALYYSWLRLPAQRLPGAVAGEDGVARFFAEDTSGVLLPGERRPFRFSFKSPTPGIFGEEWELRVEPAAARGAPARLALRGAATAEDETRLQRRALDDHLARNEGVHAAEEVLWDILRDVRTPERPPELATPDTFDAEHEALFAAQNRELKLYYERGVFQEMAALAADVFALLAWPAADAKWDASVATLAELIGLVPEEERRRTATEQLNALVRLASVPPASTQLFHSIVYDCLAEAAELVPDLSNALRRQLALPPKPFVATDGYVPPDPAARPDSKEGKRGAAAAEAKGGKKPAAAAAPAKKEEKKGLVTQRTAAKLPTPEEAGLEVESPERRRAEAEYRALLAAEVAGALADAAGRMELLCAAADLRSQRLAAAQLEEAAARAAAGEAQGAAAAVVAGMLGL